MRIGIHRGLILEHADGIIKQVAADGTACGHLPWIEAGGFIPKQNLVPGVPSVQSEGVVKFASLSVVAYQEVKAPVPETSQVFPGGRVAGCEGNGTASGNEHLRPDVVEVIQLE